MFWYVILAIFIFFAVLLPLSIYGYAIISDAFAWFKIPKTKIDVKDVDTYDKELPFAGDFTPMLYLISQLGMTSPQMITQAFFMKWLKEGRIKVEPNQYGWFKKWDEAHVYFGELANQLPFDDFVEKQFFLYTRMYCPVYRQYVPDDKRKSEDMHMEYVNDRHFFPMLDEEMTLIFEELSKQVDIDTRRKEEMLSALYLPVAHDVIMTYIKEDKAVSSVNFEDKATKEQFRERLTMYMKDHLVDADTLLLTSFDYFASLDFDQMMDLLLSQSKQSLIDAGYMEAHDNYTDDILTKKGQALKRKVYENAYYFEHFSALQKEAVLHRDKWDDYLIYASLFGLSNPLYEQMLEINPHFQQQTHFPQPYGNALYVFADSIKSEVLQAQAKEQ